MMLAHVGIVCSFLDDSDDFTAASYLHLVNGIVLSRYSAVLLFQRDWSKLLFEPHFDKALNGVNCTTTDIYS